ncbi:hypothetical protein HNR44_001064 [Geomicrobium halophilum]|uniref:Uncharacterized protein n=1 Tax=Geomicrobium halophilum TaxID=549000 RepID=A0A841PYA6_9BACL|nr:hypothetical protein [Geomicrobium halophilum]MBB6449115.1 hypothetical protein [Geomicrobium halophilum]
MLAGWKQRMQAFTRRRRQMNVHERIKENEMAAILEDEMPRFIKMTKPTFFLRPEMERSLHQFLQTGGGQRNYAKPTLTKEARQLALFYNKELSLFIKYLQKQGFQLKGNEALFAHIFLNHVAIISFQQLQKRYGTVALRNEHISTVFDRYLHMVDEERYYDIDHLEYLRQNLISKRIVPVTMNLYRLKRQLKQYEKNHEDHQINKFKRRLQENIH